MIKKVFSFLVLFMILAPIGVFGETEILKQVREKFPNFQVESAKKLPVKELWELVGNGQVFYFSPSDYIIFGEIWTSEGISLTQKTKQELAKKLLKNLPLDLAIKRGTGSKKVVEFIDVNCGFCRKLYEYLTNKDNITVYTFFYPLSEDGMKKAQWILCQSDKETALKTAIKGELDGKPLNIMGCESNEEILVKHSELGFRLGARGTPLVVIEDQVIYGFNKELIENMLK